MARLRVGVNYNLPGFGVDAADPSKGGFDIAVARYVAAHLGVTDLELVKVQSFERETSLQARTVDVVVSTYGVTDARQAKVMFAGPYLLSQQALLVQSTSSISRPQDLRGKTPCGVPGSTWPSKAQAE